MKTLVKRRLEEEKLERHLSGQLTEEEKKAEKERQKVSIWEAKTGIALYPHEAAAEDELSFAAGAQLKVLKAAGGGWLRHLALHNCRGVGDGTLRRAAAACASPARCAAVPG